MIDIRNHHLSRTYGRAKSVIRFAGAPIKITPAALAMKSPLYLVISSEWQPEKFPRTEEVVHSEPSSSSRPGRVELVAMAVSFFSPKAGWKFATRKIVTKTIITNYHNEVAMVGAYVCRDSRTTTLT